MNWKILLCSFLIATPGWAAQPDDFKTANALYDAGKFAEATAAYEKIEPKTAHVYFNLGNAWFRQEKLGLALLNYERARRLMPRDPDVLANSRFAQRRLGVEEINTPPNAVKRFVQSTVESQTLNEWIVYQLIGWWLSLLALAGWIWWPSWRTGCLILMALALTWLLGTAGALAYRVIAERTAPAAIALTTKTEARFAPLADGTVHFQLTEGTKVAVREDRGSWWLVERADGRQGWVQSETMAREF